MKLYYSLWRRQNVWPTWGYKSFHKTVSNTQLVSSDYLLIFLASIRKGIQSSSPWTTRRKQQHHHCPTFAQRAPITKLNPTTENQRSQLPFWQIFVHIADNLKPFPWILTFRSARVQSRQRRWSVGTIRASSSKFKSKSIFWYKKFEFLNQWSNKMCRCHVNSD